MIVSLRNRGRPVGTAEQAFHQLMIRICYNPIPGDLPGRSVASRSFRIGP